MKNTVNTIIATSDLGAELSLVEQFAKKAVESSADAMVILGNLTKIPSETGLSGKTLEILSSASLPTFYIPGPGDAPISQYLKEAYNIEITLPNLHGVHGTFAFAPGYLLFAGMGGTISDNPLDTREEINQIFYPGWELEYRLKFIKELKDYKKVFLFTTAPQHKGLEEKGSQIIAEFIKTHNPKLVLIGGHQFKTETLGKSLLVMPGSLVDGNFSLINLSEETAERGHLER